MVGLGGKRGEGGSLASNLPCCCAVHYGDFEQVNRREIVKVEKPFRFEHRRHWQRRESQCRRSRLVWFLITARTWQTRASHECMQCTSKCVCVCTCVCACLYVACVANDNRTKCARLSRARCQRRPMTNDRACAIKSTHAHTSCPERAGGAHRVRNNHETQRIVKWCASAAAVPGALKLS